MYKLFLKIATRYLLKNKLYSFINIFGLAIGVASFILIMLYVNYERSYDKFEGSENVYRVFMDYMEGDEFVQGDAQAYNLSGPTLTAAFPEVKEYVRMYQIEDVTLMHHDAILSKNKGALADSTYFDIFQYPLLQGDKRSALNRPYSIVLTESLANKLFGKKDPIGKSISVYWGSKVSMTVSGVLKDFPENIHMKSDFLISFGTFWSWDMFQGQQEFNWNQNNFFTYIKIDPQANVNMLRRKIIANNADGHDNERHNIEPLEEIHLYSDKPYEAEANGSITRVRFLSAIALIILFLTWLNFINLATAKSLERAKEIGIKKVAGAQRPQLIGQVFLESLLINIIAFGMAIAIIFLTLPVFNTYMDKALNTNLHYLFDLWPYFAFVLLGMLISNIYPAFVLSRYSPSKALKGKIQTSSSGLLIRKGLITLQFLTTIILLVGTIVVGKQTRYLMSQPHGTKLSQVVDLSGQVLDNVVDSVKVKDFQVLTAEVKKLPFVEYASTAETYPGDGYYNLSSFMDITKPDGSFEKQKIYYQYQVQPEYFQVMGIHFLAGDVFRPNPNGYGHDIVVNDRFTKDMGISSAAEAIGQQVKFWGQEWKIVGVMDNYHHFGLKTALQPVIIRPGTANDHLLVKLDKEVLSTLNLISALNTLKAEWKKVLPRSTFEYTFLDKKFEAQYNEDKKFDEAFGLFTFLAILIASMGLFGLTSYTVVQRRKEIGIRKVNGATITQILTLLNKDLLKWVALAFVIAVPISWYAMNKWLEGFAYKTTMSWWIFALAGLSALIIALLTVSWQSFRAATNNPVEALRDE